MRFQKKDNGVFLEFTIGSGTNTNKASIFIAPNSAETTTMTLEVSAVDDPSRLRNPDQVLKKLDVLIEDILFHIMSAVRIKEKAEMLEKGKICPKCNELNTVHSKFCNECGFNLLEQSPRLPSPPDQAIPAASLSPSTEPKEPPKPVEKPPLTEEEMIKNLDAKYDLKHECEICDFQCGYKAPFIMLLSDIANLKGPFKKFDEFLSSKDLTTFANYIYDFAIEQMKKHPKFTTNELPQIAFCIFSVLSWHILEKASQTIRLTFAKKMKERIDARFSKEHPSLTTKGELETGTTPVITIKTGRLHIEENRCPYCYRKFDERTLKLKLKGYTAECPSCGEDI